MKLNNRDSEGFPNMRSLDLMFSPDAHKNDLAEIAKYAVWCRVPGFADQGRSAETVINGRSYKLKGVGYFDRDKEVVCQPSAQVFDGFNSYGKLPNNNSDNPHEALPKILIHRGIADDGSFYPVPDKPKPLGGMLFKNAVNEFEIADRLKVAGVDACKPVMYGSYDDMEFNGERLGFVVLEVPSAMQGRVSSYFDPVMSGDGIRISPKLEKLLLEKYNYTPNNEQIVISKLMGSLCGSHARALRKAHSEAGVARFAGHTGNLSMDSRLNVIMHDFDSSILLSSLPDKAKAMTILRDIESAMFGWFVSFDVVGLFRKMSRQDFLKSNPMKKFLLEYFSDVDSEQLAELSAFVDDAFGKLWDILPRNISIVFNTHAISDLFLQVIFYCFSKSELANRFPLPFDFEQLKINLGAFNQSTSVLFSAILNKRISALDITEAQREKMFRTLGK